MKYLLAAILTFSTIGNELTKVAKVNGLKKEAEEAYNSGDFSTAIEKYQYLVDSFDVRDDKLLLNLSNAYYQIKDTATANSLYQQLTSSDSRELKSVAHQQMGIIEGSKKEYEEALQSFKHSLKANPYNEEARYNYELLKKLVEEQKQEQEQQNNQEQDQENQEQQQDGENQNEQQQQDQEQKTQDEKGEQQQQEEGESDEEKEGQQEEQKEEEGKEQEGDPENDENKQKEIPSTADKLKEMNISEEKARMILEAMKNNEIQYIQDKKRKAKQRKKPNKPDW